MRGSRDTPRSVTPFFGAFAELRKAAIRINTSVCLSVCLSLFSWNNLAHSGRILMKFVISGFFENQSRKFKV